jgi:hypothetical protein
MIAAISRMAPWPALRFAQRLRRPERCRGQIAVAFLVIIALILLVAAMTMNLGEVARLRTSTANAADAGALAGASWVASGENEVAKIAEAMWVNVLIVQAVFAVWFCWEMCWLPLLIYALLWLVNGVWLKGAADAVLHAAWDNAHAAALFTAIQNATIDDPSGEVQKVIKELGETFEETRTVPSTVKLEWTRKGAGGFPEPSSAEISVQFTAPEPEFKAEGWGPMFICLSPCMTIFPIGCVMENCCMCIYIPPWVPRMCVWWCWSTFAWVGPAGVEDVQETVDAIEGIEDLTSVTTTSDGFAITRRPGWYTLAGVPLWPEGGTCWTCIPIPGSVPFLDVSPSSLDNGAGDVIVTVKHHREGGSDLRFWMTKYPDEIVSDATAHYRSVSVDLWPKADSFAQLVGVR